MIEARIQLLSLTHNILFLLRMEDKGEVKCIKFSLENKILAVQRTSKTVVRHFSKSSVKKRMVEVRLEENE